MFLKQPASVLSTALSAGGYKLLHSTTVSLGLTPEFQNDRPVAP